MHHVLNGSASDDLLEVDDSKLLVLFFFRCARYAGRWRSRDWLLNLLQESQRLWLLLCTILSIHQLLFT